MDVASSEVQLSFVESWKVFQLFNIVTLNSGLGRHFDRHTAGSVKLSSYDGERIRASLNQFPVQS